MNRSNKIPEGRKRENLVSEKRGYLSYFLLRPQFACISSAPKNRNEHLLLADSKYTDVWCKLPYLDLA